MDYRQLAYQKAVKYGLNPDLFVRQIEAESAFNPNAVSSAGAIGLGQLMPATAKELGVDPSDPDQNLEGAARYMRQQMDRFGRPDLALAAYNAGPSRVAKLGRVPNITETQNYVAKIMGTNPAMSLSTKDAAMAPTMTPTAKPEEQQSLWDRLTGRSEATGLNPLEAFAAGLDALILPEMRMGDVIRQQGAQRAKTAKEETQRNKSIEFLKRRADAGDNLASKYLDIVSTGVLPVGTGLASYLEQSTKVQKTSEAEQQINRLMETGMDRNTAIAVRDGRIKLSRHPVTQQVELIDMATGSRIGGLTEGAASAVSEAISTSTSNQPSTFENLPVEKAGGLIGWGASIANMVTDAVGAGQAFPEVGKAQSAMENLSKRTILMLEADFAGKPTNFTREIVESMTVKPAEVLKGEEGSYLKTTQMVKMLEDAVSGARTALANPEKHSPEKIRAAEQSVAQLQSLLDDYMSLKNAFEKKGIASQTPTPKGSTVIQDPEVKALIDMYTNPNYYRDNMLPSPN